MHDGVQAQVPVLYVSDTDTARRFYATFGYAEVRTGGDGASRWSYLQCGELTLLLAEVKPRLVTVELPLLIYLYVDDLAATMARLTAAGYSVEPAGHPAHAPGGECRTTDPDGNAVVFGQRRAVPDQRRDPESGKEARFSLIREAAKVVRRSGGAPARCQIGGPRGEPCPEPAEVKLADSWGDTVWGCLAHADEALLNARGAFLATEDGSGLGAFLRSRRAHPEQVPQA
ncbi:MULTISPECIES: glyoxalase/bleomycin resistance/extradiol dioxygenase family protein [Micromonospora]|uniref:VOC family protein n=1 Tax=Micromonospora solifontis TaxID=2487138 RepID=A0ABX9WD49_9ACTN|nr:MULTISPECIES: VOC family protein [Micromonospora]NES16169.1 VOC family protein [Micromonospora sp. PPF5-17B]NES38030.1 VOC family protein [Micromonospora solifontis]NES57656.1 VOC family protein [Micromonospora sp. PPF5-6]RNL97709.1 VOC family protein [Micromonospora solifontis]